MLQEHGDAHGSDGDDQGQEKSVEHELDEVGGPGPDLEQVDADEAERDGNAQSEDPYQPNLLPWDSGTFRGGKANFSH